MTESIADFDFENNDNYSIPTVDTQENNYRKHMREIRNKKSNVFSLRVWKPRDEQYHKVTVYNTDPKISSYVVNAISGYSYNIVIGTPEERELFHVKWILPHTEPKTPLKLYFDSPLAFEDYFKIELSDHIVDSWRNQQRILTSKKLGLSKIEST